MRLNFLVQKVQHGRFKSFEWVFVMYCVLKMNKGVVSFWCLDPDLKSEKVFWS